MRSMWRLLIAGLLLLVAASLSAERRRGVVRSGGWSVPQCASISGIPSVALSLDGGRSVLPHEERDLDVQVYTFGLAALRKPDSLLAITSRIALTSTDGGCSWIPLGFSFPEQGYEFEDDGRTLWAWSQLHPQIFPVTLEGTMGNPVTAPVPDPARFHADRAVAGRLTVVDFNGRFWSSNDAGASWTISAQSPSRTPLYTAAISSRGASHAITTGVADGARVTFDGGSSWSTAAGLERLNVFRILFSPVDPDVVWAMATDPLKSTLDKRAIYHSRDGGRSFTRALAASGDVAMTNGFTMQPSPVDARHLWFALPGTSLFLMDDRGTIVAHNKLPARDVNALVFSPVSPGVMYLGLKISDMSSTATDGE